MLVEVAKFGGMRPQMSTDLLAAGEAQVAKDVRLTAGELRSMKTSTDQLALNGVPQVLSIYRFGQSLTSTTQYWFQSVGDVDYAKGPIDNDTTERTYFTDGTFPKKTDSTLATSAPPYPSASYAMGIPAPATVPTVSVTGVATNPADPGEAVNFVLTYVSSWGEEGPPSLASTTVTWRAGQTLSLSALAVAPGVGAHGENYNITGKRLYRAATGTLATQYQLCTNLGTSGTIAIATTTASDTQTTATLGEPIPSIGWIEPQFNMIGLRAGPNSMMAAFVGNTVCFCEPNFPYAWPVRYQQSTDAPIVGIEWFDQSLFVGTTQGIYIFTGSDPANMTMQKLSVAQSVVSKRSIVPMLGGVIFAAPDGLFRCDANGISFLTDGLLTRDDWQAYVPSTISAYESDGRYVAFYDNGTKAGLMFDFGSIPSFSTTTKFGYAGYRDKKADKLFFVRDTSNNLASFDTGAALSYTWTSSVFHLPAEVNFGAALIDAVDYASLNFNLFADGVSKYSAAVTSRYAFRLPGDYKSARYSFTLTGTSTVRRVEIASTMAEIGTR